MNPAGSPGPVPTLAILVGLQGSGKSAFYRTRLAATHTHVSKDNFPRARRRQERLVAAALAEGHDVAVDNTNPTPEEWGPLIALGREYGARIRGYWFPPDVPGSLRRNAGRVGRARVPDVAIFATAARLRRPRLRDGFDELLQVRFDGRGGFRVTPLER